MAPPAPRPHCRLGGALALLAALAPLPAAAQYILPGGPARLHPPHLLGRWVGVLPSRCGARRMPADVTLLLRSSDGLSPGGSYEMTVSCRVPGLVPRLDRGTWVPLRGSEMVQLTVNGRLDVRSFLRLADGALRPLDSELAPETDEVLSPMP